MDIAGRYDGTPARPTTTTSKLISAAIPHAHLDTDTCSLLGPFSILIQAIMAVIILASLLYKRHREKPKRKYHIWTADVSKQVLGQAFVHMFNILISDSMASLPSKGNPCALYFMNIFIDTTIGVFVLFLALNAITKLVCKTLRRSPASLGLSSGSYPHPFLTSWLKQITIYFLGLVMLKLFVIGLFWLGGEALVQFGNGVIEGISHNPKVQILMVVMVGPTILNVLQFLLIDSFIKQKPSVNPGDLEAEDGRRFLGGESELDSDEQDSGSSDSDSDDDNENGRKPRGSTGRSQQDRRVRKKKGLHNHPATRHQQTRLSHPSSLHGSLSAVATDVHNPHSYPPRNALTSGSLSTPKIDSLVENRPVIQTHTVPRSGLENSPPASPSLPPSDPPSTVRPSEKLPSLSRADPRTNSSLSSPPPRLSNPPTPSHLKTGFSVLHLSSACPPTSHPLDHLSSHYHHSLTNPVY